MFLQRTLTKSPRTELYADLAELISGVLLVGFLWTHMLFVSAIFLGPEVFDKLAHFLDEYYLSYVGIPFILLVAFIHIITAGRRIPNRFREQKIIWRHAKMIKHTDTWTWVFQVVTGMAILVLAGIHVWVVLTDWPISAIKSAMRIESFYLYFYFVLLLLGEYHAGMGIYRQFVKWGWFKRRSISYVLNVITLIIVGLGLGALYIFRQLGGAL
ncbi:MAG: succinate dehydrogenase [Bacillota bacterium]